MRIASASLRATTVAVLSCVLTAGGTSAGAQSLPDKHVTESGNVVTLYSLKWPTPVSPVSADVEVCAGANTPPYTFAFPSYFQVHLADGGAIGAYGSKNQPTFDRTPLQSKQCVRGWLDFAVTSGQKPVSLHYHELDANKQPIDWRLP